MDSCCIYYISNVFCLQKERREKLDQRPTVPSNRQYAAEVATPTAGSPIHHYEPPGGEVRDDF